MSARDVMNTYIHYIRRYLYKYMECNISISEIGDRKQPVDSYKLSIPINPHYRLHAYMYQTRFRWNWNSERKLS